ncbi:uracil-DNA glycosylase family protein [Galbibacter sp.]|uniref:uracil-DNA glycosylase family protein n=1 Tax=Galbibacter sp. TaxID=2918471 RepID=UPI002C01DECD|nr:uracil-DNA glycosylase family protein [Galbibacter sp.]HLV63602.1 uracil-DNA glycosylase family protein [Galbibacter sp.]
MQKLLLDIRNCTHCDKFLPNVPNPVIRASTKSKIVVIGQAPGRKVHQSGIPWDDASGANLRAWMGVDNQTFYNEDLFALMPMGFCYPGTGKSGDFPPRKECAPLWHKRLLQAMPEAKLILLIGQYAQGYYLKNLDHKNLTQRVKDFHEYLPDYFPLPHPSPRNNLWQKNNPWFKSDLLPILKAEVQQILEQSN